jgi:hypothetical protein
VKDAVTESPAPKLAKQKASAVVPSFVLDSSDDEAARPSLTARLAAKSATAKSTTSKKFASKRPKKAAVEKVSADEQDDSEDDFAPKTTTTKKAAPKKATARKAASKAKAPAKVKAPAKTKAAPKSKVAAKVKAPLTPADDDSDFELSDDEMVVEATAPAAARPSRRAAASKVSYAMMSEDEVDLLDESMSDPAGSDSDFSP